MRRGVLVLYPSATFQSRCLQRLLFCVIRPVFRLARIIHIHHQTALRPEQFKKAVFPFLERALELPQKIIHGLQSGFVRRPGGFHVQPAGNGEALFAGKAFTGGFQGSLKSGGAMAIAPNGKPASIKRRLTLIGIPAK